MSPYIGSEDTPRFVSLADTQRRRRAREQPVDGHRRTADDVRRLRSHADGDGVAPHDPGCTDDVLRRRVRAVRLGRSEQPRDVARRGERRRGGAAHGERAGVLAYTKKLGTARKTSSPSGAGSTCRSSPPRTSTSSPVRPATGKWRSSRSHAGSRPNRHRELCPRRSGSRMARAARSARRPRLSRPGRRDHPLDSDARRRHPHPVVRSTHQADTEREKARNGSTQGSVPPPRRRDSLQRGAVSRLGGRSYVNAGTPAAGTGRARPAGPRCPRCPRLPRPRANLRARAGPPRRAPLRRRTRLLETGASSSARTAASASRAICAAAPGDRRTSSRTARASTRTATPSSSFAARTPSWTTSNTQGRRDARALPAVFSLLRRRGERDRRPQPLRAGHLRRLDALGRLAHVPRRRHLPSRLVAARQPEHRGRRRRRYDFASDDDDRRARRHAAARQPATSTSRSRRRSRSASAPRACTLLDRPRTIETLEDHAVLSQQRASPLLRDPTRPASRRSSTARRTSSRRASTRIPRRTSRRRTRADSGFLLGGRARVSGPASATRFVQLFVRYAHGLAAYDPLAAPTTFANNMTTAALERDARRARRELGERACSASSSAGTSASSATATRPPTSIEQVRRRHARRSPAALPRAALGRRARRELPGAALRRASIPITRTASSTRRSGAAGSCRTSPRRVAARTSGRSFASSTRSPAATQGARDLYPREDVFSQRTIEHFLGLRRRVVVQLELVPVRARRRLMATLVIHLGPADSRPRGRARAGLHDRPGARPASRSSPRTSKTGVTRSSTRSSPTASPTAT